MILRQNAPKKDAAHGTSEHAREYDQTDGNRVHTSSLSSTNDGGILQEPFRPATCQNRQLRKEKAFVLSPPMNSETTLVMNQVLLDFYRYRVMSGVPVRAARMSLRDRYYISGQGSTQRKPR